MCRGFIRAWLPILAEAQWYLHCPEIQEIVLILVLLLTAVWSYTSCFTSLDSVFQWQNLAKGLHLSFHLNGIVIMMLLLTLVWRPHYMEMERPVFMTSLCSRLAESISPILQVRNYLESEATYLRAHGGPFCLGNIIRAEVQNSSPWSSVALERQSLGGRKERNSHWASTLTEAAMVGPIPCVLSVCVPTFLCWVSPPFHRGENRAWARLRVGP